MATLSHERERGRDAEAMNVSTDTVSRAAPPPSVPR